MTSHEKKTKLPGGHNDGIDTCLCNKPARLVRVQDRRNRFFNRDVYVCAKRHCKYAKPVILYREVKEQIAYEYNHVYSWGIYKNDPPPVFVLTPWQHRAADEIIASDENAAKRFVYLGNVKNTYKQHMFRRSAKEKKTNLTT